LVNTSRPTGPTGATGAAGGGSLIAFSSGSHLALTTIAGGLSGKVGFVSFGTSALSVSDLGAGSSIDLAGGLGPGEANSNMAFITPVAGVISGLSVYFSLAGAMALVGSTVSCGASIWSSATPDDTFTLVAGTSVTASPAMTGILAIGTTSAGSLTGLSIDITSQTRLLFVAQCTAAGLSLTNTLSLRVSGGLLFSPSSPT
jgi:BclB C-terminal domain-containing protein